MANGVELATAYVSVVPVFGNVQRATAKAMAGVTAEAERVGKRAGDNLTSGLQAGAKPNWSKRLFGRVEQDADQAGKRAGKKLGAGLSAAMGPAAALLGGAAVTGFLADSLDEAREAQKVGRTTEAIIRSTGGAAKVTSKQVGDLSGAISAKTGVDDEVIQSGANMLLTFKQVRNEVGKGNDIFDRATAAASDLSAAGFGDMAGQSKMLGKALNDPLKGMSALGRSGVTFTKGQTDQVKALVKSGKTLEAQKIILREVESQVGGTAAANADAGEKASVAWGNLKETIGTGVLPITEKMADIFTTKVAPAITTFVTGMQDGTGAGGTFRDILSKVSDIGGKVFTEIAGSVRAFAAAWKYNDGEVTSTGLPGIMERIGYWAHQAFDWLGPKLVALTTFFMEHKKVLVALLAAYAGYKVVAATMRAFNAVMAIARGLKLGYAIATGTATAATKANTTAEKIGLVVGKAKLIFLKAVTLATKGWAIAQRVLNAVLRMNPIGLVVTALIALGAGLVLAYKKSETFRRIVDAAWAAVKAAAKAVVDWWTVTAWPAIKKFFTNIGTSMVKAKDKVVGAWDSIKAKVVAVKDWITNTAWPALKSTLYKLSGFIPVVAIYRNWDKITGKFKAAWEWVRDKFGLWWSGVKRIFTNPVDSAKTVVTRLLSATGLRKPILAVWTWVRDTFKRSWDGIKKIFTNPIESARTIIRRVLGKLGLQKTFTDARDALGRIWNGLKKKMTSPMVSALRWMNSGFIRKLNGMLGKIKVDFRIPEIGIPNGFAGGGWTGPGGTYAPAGVVHADEFVIKKTSRNKFERDNPGTLDHINRFGTLPGYAIGGKVQGLNKKFLATLSAFNDAAGGRYTVNSGYRSNAHQQQLYNRYLSGNGPVAARPGSSQHNKGLAADLAPGNARDVHGALARQFGLVFTVPSESWHIEPSWGRGAKGSSGGGGFSLPSWVSNPLKWAKDKIGSLTKGFSADKYGLAGQVLPATFDSIKSAVGKRIRSAASVFGMGGGGPAMDLGGTMGGLSAMSAKAAVRVVAKQYGWDTGAQWNALDRLVQGESGWNPKAANPSSSARGLFQKMTNLHGPVESTAAGQAGWGLRYIKSAYGSPLNAFSKWSSRNPHWYADGGPVRKMLEFDRGGMLPEGPSWVVNNTGKPEPLGRMDTMPGTGPIYVQNPWTGAYHEAKMANVADGRIDVAQADSDRLNRRGQ